MRNKKKVTHTHKKPVKRPNKKSLKASVKRPNKKSLKATRVPPKSSRPKKRADKSISAPAVSAVPVVAISSGNISKMPRKRRSKNGTRMYFTQDTEDAIIQYNKEQNEDIREKIFGERIYQPFQKLVENVFNTFKFSYFETGPQDVQRECLTHLVANMHKFDPNRKSKTDPKKKSKAYSYFSIIAKHYLILLNNTNYKKFNQNVEISEDRDEDTIQLQQDDKYYIQQEMNDFIRLIVEFWEKNVEKIFTKQRDLNIANAVVNLFRNSERIDAYNKKALYLYIREMASCKTQQITKVINRMKQYHNTIQRSYLEDGDVETERYSNV
jgi:hypothetical protein